MEVFPNQVPEILNVSFPDSIVSGMKPTDILFTVNDNDGLEDILWVLIQGYDSVISFPVFQDTVFNPMDNSPVFSASIDSSYTAGKKGEYELKFLAVDRVGDFSNAVIKNVYFENNPPLLWDSQVPDTLTRPATGSNPIDTLITIRVKDHQGLSDIDEVYYFSLKPDSSLANGGNPLYMWDNGLPFLGDPNQLQYAGDLVAGDGIYSSTILLFDNALLGKYKLSIYAKDKVGQISTVLVDSIMVIN
jgi:hypothetical protein